MNFKHFIQQIPNILTWLRLLSAPVLVAVFALADPAWRDVAAAALFVVISLTDWLDGYLARVFAAVSRFGAYLDPVADKIIVIAALLALLDAERISLAVTLVLIGREIAVLALREWMAALRRAKLIAPSLLGKSKTACQMTAITLLFYHADIFALPTAWVGRGLLWVSAGLALASMFFYLRRAGIGAPR